MRACEFCTSCERRWRRRRDGAGVAKWKEQNLQKRCLLLLTVKERQRSAPCRSVCPSRQPHDQRQKRRRVASTRSQRQATTSREGQQRPRRRSAAARPRLQCPKCGTTLQQRVLHGAPIDECPQCGGLWLDRGEFARVSKTSGDNWLGHVVVDLALMMAHPAPLQSEEGMNEVVLVLKRLTIACTAPLSVEPRLYGSASRTAC
ncbi:MAG TPA: zf-TFIIB domain-containing protein [Methylomirabilota bacterium]|nr:zf-TFIIB domain-containing protein [Methylomirabilota bacterium]